MISVGHTVIYGFPNINSSPVRVTKEQKSRKPCGFRDFLVFTRFLDFCLRPFCDCFARSALHLER